MVLAPSTGCRATRVIRKTRERGLAPGEEATWLGHPPGHALVLLVRRADFISILSSNGHRWETKGRIHHQETRGKRPQDTQRPPNLGFSTQTCFPKVCWRLQQQQANIYQVIHFENFSCIVCCGYSLREWGQDQKGTVTFSRQGDSAEQLQRLGVGRTDSFL